MRRFQYRMRETDGVGIWQKASNMLMAKHLLRQCWETVRGHAFSPLEVAQKQLQDGKIADAYHTLFAEYCKFAEGPASPMLLTALMYILHYHVWHWRDKGIFKRDRVHRFEKESVYLKLALQTTSTSCPCVCMAVTSLTVSHQANTRTSGKKFDRTSRI